MNCKVVCLCSFLVSAALAFGDIPEEKFVATTRDGKNRLSLGDSLSKIFSIYGEQESRRIYIGNTEFYEYKYNGFSVFTTQPQKKGLVENLIRVINITQPVLVLANSITIGGLRNDVIKEFGEPEEEDNNSVYYYNQEWDVLELRIQFDNQNMISEIRLSSGT